MDIKMYDKILLKSGETAFIVDIYKGGEAYEADITKKNGKIITDTITLEQIEKVI